MEAKIKLNNEELAGFCEQMHLVVSSSIYIIDGMDSIIRGFSNNNIQERLLISKESLEGNNNLSYSLLQSNLFPQYMLTMVEIGETSGKLDQVLKSLALYYKKQDRLKTQIKNAISYPLVISLMVVIIMAVLVTKVLPMFGDVFANLGGSAPATVLLVTKISKIIVALLTALFAALVVFAGLLLVLNKNPQGQKKVQKILSSAAGIKNIYHKFQTAQFSNALAMLVSSGYDIHQSLELTEKIIHEENYRAKIQRALRDLEEGLPLAEALTKMQIFSGIHAQIIRLGVQTGQIDVVLQDLSEDYAQEVENSVDKMIGIIEPTLVGVTALIIGGILLTIMLPLLGIMSTIG